MTPLCTRCGCVLSHWCQRGDTMTPPECLGVTQDCAARPPGGLVLRAGLTLKVVSGHSQPCWVQCCCSEGEWGMYLLHSGQALEFPSTGFWTEFSRYIWGRTCTLCKQPCWPRATEWVLTLLSSATWVLNFYLNVFFRAVFKFNAFILL